MEAPRARQELPIDSAIPAFVAALRRTANVVVQAPTGAGKTTRIPPALLSEFGSPARLVLVVEPRRLAAQAAARRMAGERGEEVGATVGYHVRFQRSRGPQTRLLVVTEGVLLRMLLDDPWLERVEAVVFDEFHERNLQSDLALAMLRRLQQEFRPELRLVVMSATLDPDPLARYLGGEVVISEGRTFPVRIDYLTRPDDRPTPVRAADAVMRVREQTVGHVLVFLPGFGEIRRTRDELRRRLGDEGTTILELYGDLPLEAQDQVLRPSGRQKVVLATNVAETSVTIEGVTTVVDCGLARVLRYDASVGLNRLAVERIARDSA
ncbi:MAG: DEAD/DEAH box helicase, partial [Pirellulaceae bacterium]